MTTSQQSLSVRLGPIAEQHLADLLAYYNADSIANITASDVIRGTLAMAHERFIEGHNDTEPTT